MSSRDFTLLVYNKLLQTLIGTGYEILTVETYLTQDHLPEKYVILRHDVDRLPKNALLMAKLEKRMAIEASYYFRAVPESFDEAVIESIVSLGHEVGYHYEDLSLARGDYSVAYELYVKHLSIFEMFYPVRTVCMHGSPLSKWDNRDLWHHYGYKINNVIGEPYFDVDFGEVLYLSDTGRSWRDALYVIRDRVDSDLHHTIRSTFDFITQLRSGNLPSQLMINTHPQRWHDTFAPWLVELLAQNSKNVLKSALNFAR